MPHDPSTTSPARTADEVARQLVSQSAGLEVPAEERVNVQVEVSAFPGKDLRAVKLALEAIAPIVAQRTAEHSDKALRSIVDAIVETTPLRRLDMKQAAMVQRGVEAIFSGAEWLSAEQIGRLRDPAARNPHGAANRWRADGRIFAITKGGVLYYPRYALDDAFEPLPAVAKILQVLEGFSPYRVAGWFESTNSMLGGRRPRELLAGRAAAVVEAAKDQVLGAVHG